MPTDADIIVQVRSAFGRAPRPEHFTNWSHCPECEEHDTLLRRRNVDTLTLDDVGHPGWDPICYITPEGFSYYFPAFVRLVLLPNRTADSWDSVPVTLPRVMPDEESTRPISPYVGQFLFHLTYGGPQNSRWQHFDDEQRTAVVALLQHLSQTRLELMDDSSQDLLLLALDWWSPQSEVPSNFPD